MVMLVVMIMMITMVIMMMMMMIRGGLHLAGLLVGVRHQATHKVGLTVVSE